MPIVRKKGEMPGYLVTPKPNYPSGKTLKSKKSYLTNTTMVGKISLAKKAAKYAKENIMMPKKGQIKGMMKNAPLIIKDTAQAMAWTAKDAAKRKGAKLIKSIRGKGAANAMAKGGGTMMDRAVMKAMIQQKFRAATGATRRGKGASSYSDKG